MIYNNIYQFYCQHLYVKPKNTCQRVSGWFWVEYRAMLMLKWYIFLGVNMILSSLSHIWLCSCDFDPVCLLPALGAAFFCVADSSLQLVSCALWLLTPALWRGAYVGDLTSLLCLVANSCPPEIQRDPKSSQSELQSTKENHGSPNPSQNYKTIWQCWWWAEMELNPSPLCKSTFWAAINPSGVSAGISNCELISNFMSNYIL